MSGLEEGSRATEDRRARTIGHRNVGKTCTIMSYDLTVWKWKTRTRQPPVAEVLAAISEDNAHPALTRFDRAVFERALRDAFGDLDNEDAPLQCEIADFHGLSANWAGISVWFSTVEKVLPRLVDICQSQGLAMYDYQSEKLVAGNTSGNPTRFVALACQCSFQCVLAALHVTGACLCSILAPASRWLVLGRKHDPGKHGQARGTNRDGAPHCQS